jgi:NAD(P)-dependent dehydrogenase (short-subunit alcohol dehydrogenase family)
VNSISPGSIRTPLLEYGATQLAGPGRGMEDMLATFGAAHPVGRVGTVEEVAELVAYLCSDLAAFTTGADFRIDGGLTAYIGV